MAWANCVNRHGFSWFGGRGAKLQGRQCPKCGSTNLKTGSVYRRLAVNVLAIQEAEGEKYFGIYPGRRTYLQENVSGTITLSGYLLGQINRPEDGEDANTMIECITTRRKDEDAPYVPENLVPVTVGWVTIPDSDYQKFLDLER